MKRSVTQFKFRQDDIRINSSFGLGEIGQLEFLADKFDGVAIDLRTFRCARDSSFCNYYEPRKRVSQRILEE